MRNRVLSLAIIALAMGVVGTAAAQEGSPWIHIQVIEDGDDGTKVNVNLPLSLIEIALDAVSDEIFDNNRLHFNHSGVGVDDLRNMWQELRDSGDAEYVTVEDDGQTVRIFREGETVFVHVDDEDGNDKVRIEVPFSIVDTLLEGDGNRLNLGGAIREMAATMRGDIISVQDDDTTVRIWIDERAG